MCENDTEETLSNIPGESLDHLLIQQLDQSNDKCRELFEVNIKLMLELKDARECLNRLMKADVVKPTLKQPKSLIQLSP